jgi:DNA-binding XRE family transcriptional regulator
MEKCAKCDSQMRVQKYEHVTDVAGVIVRDASGMAAVCTECGTVEFPFVQLQRYEQRAAATALRLRPPTGTMLRFARRALDLKQIELAQTLGIAAETISRMETGAASIPPGISLAYIALLDKAFFCVQAEEQEIREGELSVPLCAVG